MLSPRPHRKVHKVYRPKYRLRLPSYGDGGRLARIINVWLVFVVVGTGLFLIGKYA